MNFGPCVIVQVMADRPTANIAPCATCVKRHLHGSTQSAAVAHTHTMLQLVRVAL